MLEDGRTAGFRKVVFFLVLEDGQSPKKSIASVKKRSSKNTRTALILLQCG
jgi:hypothetical protein